jgi:hypothetical protein
VVNFGTAIETLNVTETFSNVTDIIAMEIALILGILLGKFLFIIYVSQIIYSPTVSLALKYISFFSVWPVLFLCLR